ncbi:MAG: abscisic acid-deficient protein Aba4 family protein [Opitutales bacterium]
MWEFLLETFGAARLSRAFWMLTAMTAPLWLAMIIYPRKRWMRWLAHPFLIPVLLGGVVIYLLTVLARVGWPDTPEFHYAGVKSLSGHPVVFLVLYAAYQVLTLFAGTVIFQEARRRKWRVPIELLLTWWTGPLGLMAFAMRLWAFGFKPKRS